MTSKEQAERFYSEMYNIIHNDIINSKDKAKLCALIMANNIEDNICDERIDFFTEVNEELNKIK